MSELRNKKEEFKKRKELQLITLSSVEHLDAEITSTRQNNRSLHFTASHNNETESYYITNTYEIRGLTDHRIYHLPFLFCDTGEPWMEANLFLLKLATNAGNPDSARDGIREKASCLMDYKIYCEYHNIDWRDFSSFRKSRRPSFIYFRHLVDTGELKNENINRRTKVIYDFYEFYSEMPFVSLDMSRVDVTREIVLYLGTATGVIKKKVRKRGQTRPTSSNPSEVPAGFVRDEGEDLRPLTKDEFRELIDVLNKIEMPVDYKLICYIGLFTGGRKQSILTLRMKHIDLFDEKYLCKDNTYHIYIDPKSGVDTKNGKPQILRFPKHLAEQLKLYAKSQDAKDRRDLFKKKHGDILSDDEMYLFISERGNCHYIAKNDPRYPSIKTRPKGIVTHYITKKITSMASKKFPSSMVFHWTRATFAKLLYDGLVKQNELIKEQNKLLPPDKQKSLKSDSEILSEVQYRMHHSDRRTTENYLKLFAGINEKIDAQEMYEDVLFESVKDYLSGAEW
ncbi:site-specific integrase [Vibrio parahaemolyticus]|uniref:site-specific integrase n=1 Tax=Vibrio harveyi group TaxID=717610 RepID=UPI0006A62001|nr:MULTISPECIES: site-specific integrase [Vibrio harveyi group]EHJ9993044.1 site-specific integrase [Vibrio parahaemolyticus]MCR9364152.1 site-specific integrase [Vibrio antiquarius]